MAKKAILGFFKLNVNDIDKMQVFYEKAFGFKHQETMGIGTIEERIMRAPGGGSALVLLKDTNVAEVTSNNIGPVGIMSELVDDLFSAGVDAGGTGEMEPFSYENVRMALLSDPEGNYVELVDIPVPA